MGDGLQERGLAMTDVGCLLLQKRALIRLEFYYL